MYIVVIYIPITRVDLYSRLCLLPDFWLSSISEKQNLHSVYIGARQEIHGCEVVSFIHSVAHAATFPAHLIQFFQRLFCSVNIIVRH